MSPPIGALRAVPRRRRARVVALAAALLGLVGGLLVALASSRVLETLLFGVSPRDGWTFVVAGAAMLVLTVLAALGPALSATRTNPVEALRAE